MGVYLGIEFYLFVSHGGIRMTEGTRVNFVVREALFEIYTWILCLSYVHEKQTSRIQSLYLYCIKIVPFWLRNIRFFNTQQGGIQNSGRNSRLIRHGNSFMENGCQNFSYVHRSRKHLNINLRIIDGRLEGKEYMVYTVNFIRSQNEESKSVELPSILPLWSGAYSLVVLGGSGSHRPQVFLQVRRAHWQYDISVHARMYNEQ